MKAGKQRIYLDYAATTPIATEVIAEMHRVMETTTGNPSSVHRDGQQARIIIERAREIAATFINATPAEIVFTSGGTEANNMAVIGAALALRDKGRHIISSRVEHPAVGRSLEYLSTIGFDIDYLECDKSGRIDPDQLHGLLRTDTILVTVMLVNNETGNQFAVEKMAEKLRSHQALLHTDTVQAAGKIKLDVAKLNTNYLSVSAHKLYGPKGVGALYIRRGSPMNAMLFGGSQETGKRAGTENLSGIAGLARALQLPEIASCDTTQMRRARDHFETQLRLLVPEIEINGAKGMRSASISNVFFPGVKGDSLLLALDLKGVSASSGSACSSGAVAPSAVLQAMGYSDERSSSSIRFSFGHKTNIESVQKAVEIVAQALKEIRQKEMLNAR